MKILQKKIKNRRKVDTAKIVILAVVCALAVLAVCAFGIFGIRHINLKETSAKITGEETVKADKIGKKEEKGNKESDVYYNLSAIKDKYIEMFYERYPDSELSFLIKDIDTGSTVVYNPKKMNSASVIKLFIMEAVYRQMTDNSYELTSEREEALNRMITESHNASSSVFIDDFGGVDSTQKVTDENKINIVIKNSGYKDTELNRKMHDTTPPGGPSGYENYTSVEDVEKMLSGIYHKTLLKEPYNTQAMKLLKSQTRRAKIPQKILEKYPDVVVANKTGELSTVENDAAIIMGENYNLILVIFVNDIPKMADGSTDYSLKTDVQNTISEMALLLVDSYEERK